ncbi:MAG TPA: alpha/beta fold hydrolase [Acidimicrobiales bacterium]|nr:alpha/beta fold hydrolase [Acidimicrobiales bacterium]
MARAAAPGVPLDPVSVADHHPAVDLVRAGDVELCADRIGTAGDPMIVLLAGHGAQLQWWDDALCRMLADEGFEVVRFDNRDVGASTWFEDVPQPDVGAVLRGEPSPIPYTLWDMADDTAALLDGLGVERAHLVGMSMGGMIAQCVAIAHRDRVRSLCSVMSTTGAPGVGAMAPGTVEELAALARAYPDPVECEVATARRFASPAYPFDEARVRARAVRSAERANPPGGVARQLVAMLVSGDRTAALGALDLPALVVHGDADAMVPPDGGRATAEAVPGAELVVLPGVAHELPPATWPTLVTAIVALARRTDAG